MGPQVAGLRGGHAWDEQRNDPRWPVRCGKPLSSSCTSVYNATRSRSTIDSDRDASHLDVCQWRPDSRAVLSLSQGGPAGTVPAKSIKPFKSLALFIANEAFHPAGARALSLSSSAAVASAVYTRHSLDSPLIGRLLCPLVPRAISRVLMLRVAWRAAWHVTWYDGWYVT